MASSTERDQKTKKLPLRTYAVPSGTDSSSGEVIDGEIVEEAQSEEQPKGRRHGGRPRARDRREPRPAGEGERRRNDAWDARREREGLAPSAPVQGPPATGLSRLKLEGDAAGRHYMRALERSDILAAKKTPKERVSQLSDIHKGYASMMVLSCVQPLKDGINSKSVLNAVGMGTAMWILSPNFRHQVGDLAFQMRDSIKSRIHERRENEVDKVFRKAAKKTEQGKPLSEKWQKRLDRAESHRRGGRMAFTAQSAGMTQVALAENAFAAMRAPGADPDAIRAAHDSLIEKMYEHAGEDGIESEEIATAARTIVGMRLADEPELATVFTELAHGQYTKSDPRQVLMRGTGEVAWVWSGGFESRLGNGVESGSFALRGPMTADQHQAAIADTITGDMITMTRSGGAEGLNVSMVSYAAAWGLKDRPGYPQMLLMDNPLGERLRSSQLMMATMTADGISADEQQRIYSNAYVDAMETISALHPDTEEEWATRFGSNWRGSMRDFVSNPESYFGAEEDEGETLADPSQPGAWAAGPAAGDGGERERHTSARTARRYRSARINQDYIESSETGLTGFGSDSSDHRDQGFDLGG